jgi:hypothetical protein
MESGEVLCWGGIDASVCDIPQEVLSNGAIQIRATFLMSFAQLRRGNWVAWGSTAYAWDAYGWDQILDIVDIVEEPFAGSNSLALFDNGTLLTTAYGNLRRRAPMSALTGINVTAVCTGDPGYAMALDQYGNVWSWGSDFPFDQAIWRAVPDNLQGRAKSIACGCYFAIVELTDGNFVQWGGRAPPGLVPTRALAVAAGSNNALFLAPTGKVQQTGVLTVNQTGMVVPPDLSDIKSISAAYNYGGGNKE